MSDYNIGVEDYGYPKIVFLGRGCIRITQGWFFPEAYPNESCTYIDYYINSEGKVELILDCNGNCHFDFWTPLDDYTLGWIKGVTIGDLHKMKMLRDKMERELKQL